ncbi:hypothetical protein [Streptomyces sp. XD-27]|uniref:hypothetical protein n=1 Tax=Streptomyces sp. XD-27 TaxID=3062779 RepID=UPI0026F44FA9|nr:hypothetical protein [Streptomyces sp. XD-27]WKX70021.1 hypothetical protein Q3Y56_08955 [Streptomyces sp. XD-27]
MANDADASFVDAFKEVHTPDSFARALLGQVLRAAPEKMSQSGSESVEFNARFTVARPGTYRTSTQSVGVCICVIIDGWEICACVEI